MTDIVKLLRDDDCDFDMQHRELIATEIEQLRNDLAELRKAHGEPVAEVVDQRLVAIEPQLLKDGTKLYTSAPSIHEGCDTRNHDFSAVGPLTHRKTSDIVKRDGYAITGFVLTYGDGLKCIVDMSTVRWIGKEDFFYLMHTDAARCK